MLIMAIEPIKANISIPNFLKEVGLLSMMGKMSPTAFQDTAAAVQRFGCSAQRAQKAFAELGRALTMAELEGALQKHTPAAKPPSNRPWYRQTRW